MIAVTGATGNVGRALVHVLADAGEQVAAISRHPSGAVMPVGVRPRRADLADPGSLEPALQGVHALFLLVAGDNAPSILDVAKSAGVQGIVLLSSLGAGTRPASYDQAAAFEQALQQSGLDWTILRPGGFDSNTLMWADTIRSQRTVVAPFPDTGLPTIDPVDIADIAAVTLRTDGHGGQTYVLTGPSPITPRQQVEAIGAALGTPLRFVEQHHEDARRRLVQYMPEAVADSTLAILGTPTADEQRVSPAVEQILGRPAHSFTTWAQRNIAAFS